jgi:hypothetical protein
MSTLRSITNKGVFVAKYAASNVTNTKVSVGSSSTPILSANPNRLEFVVVNDSSQVIYLNLSGTAVINEGIRLNASGGAYMNSTYEGAISAICASGGANLTVCEIS